MRIDTTGKSQVYQFRIALIGVDPAIWRTIQVPSDYSFWDLHVAIQDAMGWHDSHLHAFEVTDPSSGRAARIGIAGEWLGEPDDTLPGCDLCIADYFSPANATAEYEYDFGDGWRHEVVLEKTLSPEAGAPGPRCLAGERACPPEDVGGAWEYAEFLEALADPKHEEHEAVLEWVGGPGFDPERFDASRVRFDNPDVRWEQAWGEEGDGPAGGGPGEQVGQGGQGAPLVIEIEGFAAPQVGRMLEAPFDEERSPLVLETGLADEDFDEAPLVRDSVRYLRMLAEREPLKLTQAGNLSRRFVQELAEAGLGRDEEYWRQSEPLNKEADSPLLSLVNTATAELRLTRKQHGKLLLTKKGQAFASGKKDMGVLYRHLFEFCATKLNWAYQDLYPESWVLQAGFPYSLFLLQRYGDERRPSDFYADRFQRAFPMVLDDFPFRFRPPEEEFRLAYEGRTFRHFAVRFGLATQIGKAAFGGEDVEVLAGPLLSRVIGWRGLVGNGAHTEGAGGPADPEPDPQPDLEADPSGRTPSGRRGSVIEGPWANSGQEDES